MIHQRNHYKIYIFFFYKCFLSRTLATHRTAGEGRGSSFLPLYHFHPLTNIHTYIYNFAYEMTIICDALRDLVPFAQFKKRENTHGGVFFTFLKLRKWYQVVQNITHIFNRTASISRLLLDKIYHLIEWPFDWLTIWC